MTIEGDLGRVRELFNGVKAGTADSFSCWQQLAQFLLHASVCDEGQHLRCIGNGPARQIAGGWSPANNAVQLLNGYWLRLSQNLVLVDTDNGPRVKVESSSFQYQLHEQTDGVADVESWLFRYDYDRTRKDDDHPPGHMHVRAEADPKLLFGAKYEGLDRIHFPTGRMSLEAIIRLLMVQFGIEPLDPVRASRVLHESETMFLEIAHQPTSGRR